MSASVVISILTLLSGAISFLNQVELAKVLGAGPDMDAYLLGISLPLTISGLVAGILGYQLVPALARSRLKDGSSRGLTNATFWGIGGIALGFAIFGSLYSAEIIKIFSPKLGMTIGLATSVAQMAWMAIPLAVAGAVLTAELHVHRAFFVATIAQVLPMLGTLFGCVFGFRSFGPCALVAGQLIGYFVMLLLLWASLTNDRAVYDWLGLKSLLLQMPPALLALLIFTITPFSDSFWGARVGPSAVSYLGYAQRLCIGISSLLAIGIVTVLFPELASKAASGQGEELQACLIRGMRLIFVVMFPAAIFFAILAFPITQALFQRGAFKFEDSRVFANLLPFMLAGIVAASAVGLVFKALFAAGEVRLAAKLSVAGGICYFCCSGLLSKQLGVQGIGLTYAATWWLTLAACFWRFKSRSLALAGLRFFLKLGIACFFVGIFAWVGKFLIQTSFLASPFDRLVVIGGSGLLAMIGYLSIGETVFGLRELQGMRIKAWSVLKLGR